MSGDRFDDLFASLEAQAAADAEAELEADVDEVTRATVAEIPWLDRLRSTSEVDLEIAGVGQLAGLVKAVGRDVVEVTSADGEWLIAVAAVEGLVGLGDVAVPASTVAARLGLAARLRSWARERAVVRVYRCTRTPLEGTVDRVGADFIDLAEHHSDEPRRAESVRRTVIVPMAAISAVRRLR